MNIVLSLGNFRAACVFILTFLVVISPFIGAMFDTFFYLIFIILLFVLYFLTGAHVAKLSSEFLIILFMISLLFIFLVVVKGGGSNLEISSLIITAILLFLSKWMVDQNTTHVKWAAFYSLVASYLFIFLSTYSSGFTPSSFNNIFPGASRNFVSAFLIFIQMFYIVAYFRERNKIPLYTPIVTFIFCVVMYGRSGVLFSFILLLSVYAYSFFRSRYSLMLKTFALFFFVVAILLLFNSFVEYMIENT
jgi:hypothetical protein